jgi:hypothetical protein
LYTTEWIDLQAVLQIRSSLQVVFGVAYCLCLYAGFTYFIVLTIVHFDGTSILSLYNIQFEEAVAVAVKAAKGKDL